MSNDNAFNGKLGVNMVLDSTPDTGPRVHAKENPRVSEMAKILRDHARHDYAECPPGESDFWAAADALEAKDKLIAELLSTLRAIKSVSERHDVPNFNVITDSVNFALSKAKEQE